MIKTIILQLMIWHLSQEKPSKPIFQEIVKTKFWIADRKGYKHFSNKTEF